MFKERKNKGKRRRSIKTQLILIMGALVAVPVLIAILVSAISTRSEGIDTANEINDVQAHLIEMTIKDILDENMQVMMTFAAAPSTISYLDGTGDKAVLEPELMDQMKDIDANLDDGNSTIITGPDGQQLLRTVGDPVNVADREYFTKAMSGTPYVSDVQISKSNGSRITTFAVPIWNEEETAVIGIVQRNYDLSDFHDILASEITEERQEIVMVDRTGSVVAHSGHEIDPDNPEDQSGNPFYTDSRGDKTSGDYVSEWAGDTWMISWVKEEQTGWVVASCRIEAVALRHVTTMVMILVVMGVIFLVAGVVIAYLVSKSFTGPVEVLNASLSDLANGEFKEIEKYTKRNDEFGEMVNETNTVIDKIKEVVTDLKEVMSRLGESSQSLAETSGQISQTADDVSEAVQEIAKGATEQADTIQKATENITTLSDAIQNVANNAEGLASTATTMSDSSSSSAEALKELSSNMDSMN
ncbi:MAG: methyl-accepting chemotaxis protein, partial [Lachnospiraceae bacterium]|nr:methyl-accepting chemotaxis protein [Lachnospiraceae bacterium]